jgi:hypothetical protein
VSKFCPKELEKSDTFHSHLTAAVFSHDGTEILGSYNDDDVYLFPTSLAASSGDDGVKRYRGHLNSATVKGVNFYGPHSEYVISGSDCGNIFFWSKVRSHYILPTLLFSPNRSACSFTEERSFKIALAKRRVILLLFLFHIFLLDFCVGSSRSAMFP